MELSEREESILKAVIESYVAAARPVSSSAAVKSSSVELSSATVRNVMRALEEKGLILQPHTSAGRVPTDLGYRYYVDHLLKPSSLPVRETDSIEDELNRLVHRDMSGVLAGVSHLMSELSRELAVAVAPSGGQPVSRARLVEMGGQRVLAVISTGGGPARTAIITASGRVARAELNRASELVNEWIRGTPLGEAAAVLGYRMDAMGEELSDPLRILLEGVRSCLEPAGDRSVHYDGARYIFRHPEFSSDASSLGEILDSDEALAEMMRGPDKVGTVRVVIGRENVRKGMQRMSLVSGTYRIGGSAARTGIIGPTRMKYQRMISLVQYFTEALDRLFSRAGP
jgi:heat-inducible transcriptional repressor